MSRRASPPSITRALSVRQPYIELILAGRKTIEYRSRATRVRERVYLYASQIPGPACAFTDAELSREELPIGLILGSVEITNCVRGEEFYEWQLARPERLTKPLKPTRRPQPMFFFPFAVPDDSPERRRTNP
ncbi:ASCH domain-containing protein [Anatilimnocola floriformis]|uniref:ASCH domain-containing protein n=1 Tax=Anatilimnocola floriformis TaxID=2948575 RepID=UPI0020C3F901|nr:ASCH domain-containing protein [Anatilimnocola floriformis]